MGGSISIERIYVDETNKVLGKDVNVRSAGKMSIQITGTSTTHLIKFWGSLDSELYSPLEGILQSDSTVTAISTTGINELWQFDVSTIASFRATIESISDGNISIRANAVI